jgi:hypothetical protein
MDIDDEELCFVGESAPISLDALKRQQGKLPPATALMGPVWTRLAVDLGQRFDGITVANTALQQRYGIAEQAQVVLFFGTPRRHKGLLEVAAAVCGGWGHPQGRAAAGAGGAAAA